MPGESHGQRSLVGYSSYGHKESVMTEVAEHAHTKINKAYFFSQVTVILGIDESMVQSDVCYNWSLPKVLRDKHKARVLSILQRHRELQICVKSLHYMIFRESLNDCVEGFAKNT